MVHCLETLHRINQQACTDQANCKPALKSDSDLVLRREALQELVDLWFVDACNGLDVLANCHLDRLSVLIEESRA